MNRLTGALGSGPGPIAVHVSARAAYAAQLEPARSRTGPQMRLVAAAEWPRRAEGEALTTLETSEFIAALWRQGFTGRELMIALPPTATVAGVLELPPRGSGAPIEQLARLELARSRGLGPSAFEMSMWDLPIAGRGESTRVMTIAGTHDRTEAQIAPFDGLGVWTSVIEPLSVSLSRAAAWASSRTGADDLVGVIEVGWAQVTVLALVKGIVVYERVLPGLGVERLFADCQRKHGLGHEATVASLSALRTGQPCNARRVLRDIRARLAEFAEHTSVEAQRSFAYTGAKYPSVSLREVRLSGEGGWLPMLGDRLIGALGVKCSAITPAELVESPDWLLDLASNPALTAVVGLGLRSAVGVRRSAPKQADLHEPTPSAAKEAA